MSENVQQLTAYNVRTKEKNVPMHDVVISRTAKGAYMAKGHDGNGNPLTTLCNQAKAFDAIRAGLAKADGFEVPPAEATEEPQT